VLLEIPFGLLRIPSKRHASQCTRCLSLETLGPFLGVQVRREPNDLVPAAPDCRQKKGRSTRIAVDVSGDDERQQLPSSQHIGPEVARRQLVGKRANVPFDSRRLHQLSSIRLRVLLSSSRRLRVGSTEEGRRHLRQLNRTTGAAGLRCIYRCVVARSL
jgi:hypothetical protein